METKATVKQVTEWVKEAGKNVRKSLQHPLVVEQKSGRTDLVTNIDKMTETFFVDKIRTNYPGAKIMGEEGLGDKVSSLEGQLWIIDPIDGTLNFVKQQENFCIMLALYVDGTGELGFIYEVMKDKLYYGGRSIGIFCNDEPMRSPLDTSLQEGLIGMNSYMYVHNIGNAQKIADTTMGVRISGCAGIEFIQVIRGKQIAYLSNLAPWDFAAGKILAEELGLVTSGLNGNEVDLLQKNLFLVATKKAAKEILSVFD